MCTSARVALVTLLCAVFGCSFHARAEECRAVVLDFDDSGSMYQHSIKTPDGYMGHWKLQLTGHVRALANPEVQELLRLKPTYLAAALWSQVGAGKIIVPFMKIKDASDIALFSSLLTAGVPQGNNGREHGTSHNEAIEIAMGMLAASPCSERIIDIVTDESVPLGTIGLATMALSLAEKNGITVNILAIDTTEGGFVIKSAESVLKSYDGFVEPALGWENFIIALERKMIKELTVATR